jgi:hypothetical protein
MNRKVEMWKNERKRRMGGSEKVKRGIR